MKIFIVLFLSCVSAMALDTGIQVTTSSGTDPATGAIVITQTYMRDGQKDLVRITKSQDGVVIYRSHGFYHDEKLVALYTWRPDYSTFNVVPQTSYYVGLEFLPSREIKSLTIRGIDFIDGFYNSNGIFDPAPDSDLVVKPVK